MPHIIGCGISVSAAEPAEPETITIAGKEYRVIPDEVFRKMGYQFSDVPPEKNAATDYLKTINAYKPWQGETGRDPLDVLREGWPDDDKELREYVAENQETLKHLRAGAVKQASHFPFVEAPPGVFAGPERVIFGAPHLPLYRQERELARFLWFVGLLHEHDGDLAVAMDTYLTAVALGAHVSQDRRLLDALTAMCICRIGIKGVRVCAAERQVPNEVLLGAQMRLVRLRKLCPSHLAIIRSERVQLRAAMDYVFRLDGAPLPQVQAWIRRADIEFWDAFEAAAQLPTPEYVKPKMLMSKTRHDRLRRAQAQLRASVRGQDMGPFVSHSTMMRYPILHAQQEVVWMVTDVFLALARYRARHGRYPARLHDAKALMLFRGIDPFSGGLLRYRREADGSFTLWSVGANLKDDGGKIKERKPRWLSADYVWNSGVICGEE